jgi:hypothetical protein
LTRVSALVVFLTLLFGISTLFASSCSALLILIRSFQTTLALKLFGFLPRRGFIVRNSCRIAYRPTLSRSVSSRAVV